MRDVSRPGRSGSGGVALRGSVSLSRLQRNRSRAPQRGRGRQKMSELTVKALTWSVVFGGMLGAGFSVALALSSPAEPVMRARGAKLALPALSVSAPRTMSGFPPYIPWVGETLGVEVRAVEALRPLLESGGFDVHSVWCWHDGGVLICSVCSHGREHHYLGAALVKCTQASCKQLTVGDDYYSRRAGWTPDECIIREGAE